MKISVVVTVLNEEKNIKECLKSVKGWADEIVVVDDGSIDSTVSIAKEFTDKIFEHESKGYVEPSRNFAISKASNEWVLILDADERLTESLKNKLTEIATKGSADFVKIPRKNITFNKWIQNTMWWPDYQLRFFKKGKIEWSDKIHSVPKTEGKELKLEPIEENAIVHHNYDSISQFIQKVDRYTDVEAKERSIDEFSPGLLIRKPAEEFVSRFFSEKGYKDGVHGLALSLLTAFYALVVQLKLWEKKGFKEENVDVFKEVEKEVGESSRIIKFWLSNSLINEASNPIKKFTLKVRKKLR